MNRSLPILVLAALVCAPRPVRADFYTVEGRFQCLDKPGAVCFDAAIARPSLLSEPTRPPAMAVAAPESHVVPPPPVAPPVAVHAPAPAPDAPVDPMLAIARRIELGAPAAGDLAELDRRADADDMRALELLAWCRLRGIGAPKDAMAAYELYGKAAAAGVPHAGENQRLVFEQSLNSGERQRLFEIAARAARVGPLAGPDLPAIP
jgi:hypothetical protein